MKSTGPRSSPINAVRAVTVVLLFLIGSASYAFGASGTLTQPSQPVLWSGTAATGGGHIGEVPECTPGCDRFDLTIDLPHGVWETKTGGVEIAIRWSGHTLGDNVRLYVYRDGTLIATSDGIIAIAQSVIIPTPTDGLYRVYVAYDPDSPNAAVPYEGLAEVEYAPNVRPNRQLLPDLVVRPHQNLSFDPGGIFFDSISSDYPSCYQSEVDEEGARLCFRFDQLFANVGAGPMELRFSVPTGMTPPTAPVSQRIYRSDGASDDVSAGHAEFHAAHGHYHFTSFGLSRLWVADIAGGKVDSQPIRERKTKHVVGRSPSATGRKVSFCLADITIDLWAQKGNGPRTYNAPDCLFPASSDGNTDFFVQGITNGWTDIYDWYLPDQYIEVSGVPDGIYLLETITDPDGLLIESDDTNNCGSVLLRLSNMTSPVPSVELLGSSRTCR